jgi:transcriptional regulator with GAF, ATPase, and Fis domain
VVGQGRWRRIADLLQEAAAGADVASAVAEVVAELIGVDDVSLMLVAAGQPVVSSGTSALAVGLAERQIALGEGPSVEALGTGASVELVDLRSVDALDRAPVFISEARSEGVGAMFAFPLRIGGALVGVLTGTRASAGPMSAGQYADALIVSTLATIALLHEGTGASSARWAQVLDQASILDGAVQIAAGMVAEQLDVTILEALVRMRAHAFAVDEPIEDVARSLIARERRLER